MNARILVIDDEESICEILKYNLQKEGYEVDTANSAEEALTRDLPSYQLFIVDIMMDKLSGFDFARKLKYMGEPVENTPILFCSALGSEDDVVMGLNIGADDYITKPFSIPTVLARVRSVLRRAKTAETAVARVEAGKEPDVTFRGLRLNRNDKTCYVDGSPLQLTRIEFDLLHFFLTHRNRIYSREEIIRNVWSNNVVVTNRTVDTNLARLRKKLGVYGKHIDTRVGFGYGFKETA